MLRRLGRSAASRRLQTDQLPLTADSRVTREQSYFGNITPSGASPKGKETKFDDLETLNHEQSTLSYVIRNLNQIQHKRVSSRRQKTKVI